jgi:replicative DNA helicase
MAEYAAIKTGKAVIIFSMEMSASQLALRLISSLGRIDAQRLRTGDLADEEWPRVTHAITMLSDAKIFIDDTPALTPTEAPSGPLLALRQGEVHQPIVAGVRHPQSAGRVERYANRQTELRQVRAGRTPARQECTRGVEAQHPETIRVAGAHVSVLADVQVGLVLE